MADSTPSEKSDHSQPVTIAQFQGLIREMYFEKDVARGVAGTFMWLMEEVGELSSALREVDANRVAGKQDVQSEAQEDNLKEEFADVLAWLTTLANVVNVDLDRAIREKYGSGCPGCQQLVCSCPDSGKP